MNNFIDVLPWSPLVATVRDRLREDRMLRVLPRSIPFLIVAVLFGLGLFQNDTSVSALDNGLALTPPMGWNSWYPFRCEVGEKRIREQANALIRLGLREAGYNTVIVDDCWSGERDSEGRLTANDRFPNGMKAVGDFLHGRSLKFGIYTSRGTRTCMDFTASEDHEALDAQTFAEWGVDYVKDDNCPYTQDGADMQRRYTAMRDGILATGRPMVFSIVMWEFQGWHPETGNMSRTMGDILGTWDSMIQHFLRNSEYASHARPGYWNDPDVLLFDGGMNTREYRTYFSLWAISAAPLFISANLFGLPEGTLQILKNREVIAINQDPLGIQATQIANSGSGKTVWSKPLSTGEFVIAMLNEDTEAAEIAFDGGWLGLGNYEVRDIWANRSMGTISGAYTTSVESHGIVLLRITPR